MPSVFEQYRSKNYPHKHSGRLHLNSIAGGAPLDPAMLERHLRTKLNAPDDLVRESVAEIMLERGIDMDEAVEEAAKLKGHVGFYRDAEGYYLPASNFKAGVVEAACIAAAEGRVEARGWGRTNKGIKAWLVEHIFVEGDKLHITVGGQKVDEPTEIAQSFIHKVLPGRGPVSAIQYTEIMRDCEVAYVIETDHKFDEETWAAIWLTAERVGFGAARKRGYGTGEVVAWEDLGEGAKAPKKDAAALRAAA